MAAAGNWGRGGASVPPEPPYSISPNLLHRGPARPDGRDSTVTHGEGVRLKRPEHLWPRSLFVISPIMMMDGIEPMAQLE